jgi:hypothetical protein
MPTDIRNPEMVTDFTLFMNRHNKDDLDPVKYKFSACDLDGVFIGRYTNTTTVPIYLLEVKAFGKGMFSDTQRTALTIMHKVFEASDGQPFDIPVFKTIQTRTLVYLGVHVLRCSGKDPDESAYMTWDGYPITRDGLIKTLRFETPPKKVEPYFV